MYVNNGCVPWSAVWCSSVVFHCGVKQVAQYYQLCPQQKGTSAYIITGGNLKGIVGQVPVYSTCIKVCRACVPHIASHLLE